MQIVTSVLRSSLGEWSGVLLRSVLLSVLFRAAVIALLVPLFVAGVGDGSEVPPWGEVLLIPDSSLKGDNELVDVYLLLEDGLHVLKSDQLAGGAELEPHGVCRASVVPESIDALVLDVGDELLSVAHANSFPVSLRDSVAALERD